MNRLVLGLASLGALASCTLGGASSERYESLRTAGVYIVRERPNVPEILRNATLRRGSFFLERSCLGLMVDGSAYTPLLPAGSRLEQDGKTLRAGASLVTMGREYSLPFANEVEGGVDNLRSDLQLPAECPQRLMSIGAPK